MVEFDANHADVSGLIRKGSRIQNVIIGTFYVNLEVVCL